MCLNCLLGVGLHEEDTEETVDLASAVAEVPEVGWRVGNYEILEEIGRGGMGVIYRARQRHSKRIVALKRVLGYHGDSRDTLGRFRREAEAAASLDHPNILPIYEVGESEGLPFFTMKYAAGGSLQKAAPGLSADPAACVALLAKIARGVAHAHKAGVLHRDLKPGNILLDGHGEPLVSDFGLAKWIDTNTDLTRSLAIFGTPGFIAPEQAHGPAGSLSGAADIYSLGAILFDLLTGQPPFLGEHALAVIRQAADNPAPKLRSIAPTLDRDLETICGRCLERDPEARYRSADELADDLDHWVNGRPIIARPVSPPVRIWRWSKRNPILAGAATACLLLATAVAWLLVQPLAGVQNFAAPEKSIAVLPFEDVNAGPENEFFSEGIQEEILTDLGKVADLKVISRSSVRNYKAGTPRELPQIATALNVRHVLEGSVRRTNDRIRVNVHLTDAKTGGQLWAEQYDRAVADVFSIQSEIAQEIAAQLRVRLSPREQASIEAKPTADLLAYELYLRAKEIGHRAGLTTAERTEHQVSLLEEAVKRDPQFASAYCLLARVHVQSYWSNIDPSPARLAAAWTALNTAAALQPDVGEVHLNRCILHYWGNRDYEPALAELAIARRLMPNEAEVLYFQGLIERRKGNWESSTRHLEQARGMDPLNLIILFDLGRTNYFVLKRYRDAAQLAESVLAWKPDAFDFQLARAKVDVSSRGDLRRLHALLWTEEVKPAEPELLAFERVELAIAERDYLTAEEGLSQPKLSDFTWSGYLTPRDWYRGVIARGLGREEEALTAFAGARDAVAAMLAKRPGDAKFNIVLAEIYAHMHQREEAIRAGERAHQALPIEKDAVDGPNIACRLAGVYAQLGDAEHALDLLETAARLPNGTNYGALQLDDTWDPLRREPRFQAIVASLQGQSR
ncbi:MAG: protein kinase [Verrucomicrobiota bacterium]|nr:protein kinase [Verrucomicrobiota bacterium]